MVSAPVRPASKVIRVKKSATKALTAKIVCNVAIVQMVPNAMPKLVNVYAQSVGKAITVIDRVTKDRSVKIAKKSANATMQAHVIHKRANVRVVLAGLENTATRNAMPDCLDTIANRNVNAISIIQLRVMQQTDIACVKHHIQVQR